MSYQLTEQGSISISVGEGSVMFLPPEDNGTPEWRAYQDWLGEGNTPLPAPAPPAPPAPPTAVEKLAAAGLTVEELKALLAS
jgi:hypothetical protein